MNGYKSSIQKSARVEITCSLYVIVVSEIDISFFAFLVLLSFRPESVVRT